MPVSLSSVWLKLSNIFVLSKAIMINISHVIHENLTIMSESGYFCYLKKFPAKPSFLKIEDFPAS